ncbi:MAG TPA: protein-L-isoaspartate(D-aspartate) O-methyltransferase [Casimicrobiaceae bacterium]|nr:protein-L-isoaspartate(D-aspartate) O-methyltransferase [Casimicrobiaceae bacterium]
MRRRRFRARLSLFLLLFPVLSLHAACAESDYSTQRQRMIEEIAAVARIAGAESGKPTISSGVIATMAKVPRHGFVPADQERFAYENRPLPIGYGQTISQPYIVALMTDLMHVEPSHTVLEIGTGSGYQAAILAELARSVCTIEIVEPLAAEAQRRLLERGYGRVRVKVGDGYYGWEDCGPFDSIIVTAAVSHVPPPLIRQLKAGGRIVVPVGAAFLTQHLLLVEKKTDGSIVTRQILPVRFVPLTGGH